MKYKEFLESKLSGLVPDDLTLPSGYDLIGHVVLLRAEFDEARYLSALGSVTLEFEKRARSVVAWSGPTTGIRRLPSYQLIAGDSFTETIHIENGVQFKLDPVRITFSGGNKGERIQVRDQVRPGEVIVDMFACVGQFALHASVQDAVHVIAIEINDTAFGYLVENISLNCVEDKVQAILGDCRDKHPIGVANRVYMGFLHNTILYLPFAFETLQESGGIIHMHMAQPLSEVSRHICEIEDMCVEYGFDSQVMTRRVKWYSPGVAHIVYDIVVLS